MKRSVFSAILAMGILLNITYAAKNIEIGVAEENIKTQAQRIGDNEQARVQDGTRIGYTAPGTVLEWTLPNDFQERKYTVQVKYSVNRSELTSFDLELNGARLDSLEIANTGDWATSALQSLTNNLTSLKAGDRLTLTCLGNVNPASYWGFTLIDYAPEIRLTGTEPNAWWDITLESGSTLKADSILGRIVTAGEYSITAGGDVFELVGDTLKVKPDANTQEGVTLTIQSSLDTLGESFSATQTWDFDISAGGSSAILNPEAISNSSFSLFDVQGKWIGHYSKIPKDVQPGIYFIQRVGNSRSLEKVVIEGSK